MALNRAQIKALIKQKIQELSEKEDPENDNVEPLELFSELLLIVIDEILQNATVTGICGGAGSALTMGKIT